MPHFMTQCGLKDKEQYHLLLVEMYVQMTTCGLTSHLQKPRWLKEDRDSITEVMQLMGFFKFQL